MAYAQFRERLMETVKFTSGAFQTFYSDLGTIIALDEIYGNLDWWHNKEYMVGVTAEAFMGATPWAPSLKSSMFGTIAFNVLRKNHLFFESHQIANPDKVGDYLKSRGLEGKTGRLLAALGTAVTLDRDVHQHNLRHEQFQCDIPVPHLNGPLAKLFLNRREVYTSNDEHKRIVLGIAAGIFLWIVTHETEEAAETIYNQMIEDHGDECKLLQILEKADLPPLSEA